MSRYDCTLLCLYCNHTFISIHQVILIISGNLSFLNWLTIVPSLAYFDDRWYAGLFSRATRRRVAHLQHLQQKDSPLVDPGTAADTPWPFIAADTP